MSVIPFKYYDIPNSKGITAERDQSKVIFRIPFSMGEELRNRFGMGDQLKTIEHYCNIIFTGHGRNLKSSIEVGKNGWAVSICPDEPEKHISLYEIFVALVEGQGLE